MAQAPNKRPVVMPQNVPQTQQPQADLVDLVTQMQGWFKQLERYTAAYNSLQMAYLTFVDQLPSGCRGKGLPLLEFTASLTTSENIACVLDLKKINPEQVPGVLLPLIESQAAGVAEAVTALAAIMNQLIPLISPARPYGQQTQAELAS